MNGFRSLKLAMQIGTLFFGIQFPYAYYFESKMLFYISRSYMSDITYMPIKMATLSDSECRLACIVRIIPSIQFCSHAFEHSNHSFQINSFSFVRIFIFLSGWNTLCFNVIRYNCIHISNITIS